MLAPHTPATHSDLPSALVPVPPRGSRLDFHNLFGTGGPIEVDVGCGKGRFLIAKARAAPRTGFLGLDKRRQRLDKVDRKLRRERLGNVRLMLVEAAYAVEELLPPRSVSHFYIFFPDPWPKRRHHRRRLFSPEFLTALHRALTAGGRCFVATDDKDYFATMTALLRKDVRFTEMPGYEPTDEERTEFETTFVKLGRPIHRCGFAKAAAPEPTSSLPRRTP